MSAMGDIGQGVGGFAGSLMAMAASGSGGRNTLRRLVSLWEQLQTPGFDMRSLPPEDLKIVAEYFPEQYKAHVPESAAQVSGSPEVRKKQMANLDYLAKIRDEGMTEAETIAADRVARNIQKEHQAAVNAGLMSLRQRGRSGGGAEAALRLGASQQASEMAKHGADSQRFNAVMNRYRAAQDLGQQSGMVRGQDFSEQSYNADAQNRFNEFMSRMLTDEARDNAASRERAQWQNASERQRVADFNEIARANSQRENLNRRNTLSQQDFNNRVTRLGGQSNAMMEQAMAQYAEQAARRDNIHGANRGLGRAAGGVGQLFMNRYGGGGMGGGGMMGGGG